MKRSEELDQLLKNLHLKRILEIYDEQVGAAEKEDLSYCEFLTRLLRAQWHNRQETNPYLGRTRFCGQSRKYRFYRPNGCRKNRTSDGPAAEGFGERLSLSVHSRPGPVR